MTSLVIIAVAISAISGCSQGPQKKAQDQEHRPGVAEGVAPVFSDGPMAAAYEQYIQLKDALVASDQNKAASSAGSLHTTLQKFSEGGDTAQAAAVNAAIHAAAIAAATGIDAQRATFSALSNQMAELIKAADIASGTVYLTFCPMANDDQGAYWLANEQEIRNPYFGEKMMKCGVVKSTIQ